MALGNAWGNGNLKDVHAQLVWGGSIVLAAALVAVGYIVASDVRSRAAASAATLSTKATIADTMIRIAEAGYKPTPAPPTEQILAQSPPIKNVRNTEKPADEETGWMALLVKLAGDEVKGSRPHAGKIYPPHRAAVAITVGMVLPGWASTAISFLRSPAG